jgi:hypothetical protein
VRKFSLGDVLPTAQKKGSRSLMDADKLHACLGHLLAAECLMEEARDLASLARLALVIDLLHRAHGLPERALPELTFARA